MTTKKEKLKSWLKSHPDAIFLASVATAATAVVIVTGVAYVKASEKSAQGVTDAVTAWNAYANRINNWVNEEHAKGNDIYILDDEHFLVIPTETPREYIPM